MISLIGGTFRLLTRRFYQVLNSINIPPLDVLPFGYNAIALVDLGSMLFDFLVHDTVCNSLNIGRNISFEIKLYTSK